MCSKTVAADRKLTMWVLLCGNRGRASGSRHDFKAVQAEEAVSLVYFVYTLLANQEGEKVRKFLIHIV